ncbi:MAG TPA: hypothetical protein VLH86_05050 [Patescibacteria group bacterium]|nr:hypothetical protein [Patescibacteria group bacterium]
MENERYQPAPQVLEQLKQINFVAVVGPSAVGKTTLIREAMKHDATLHLVLNNTSRDPRPDEREGIDYRFESRARMEEGIMRHEFVQVAPSVFGDLYATSADDYLPEAVNLLPVLADAMPVFRALPFKSIRTIYVVPPDWDTWQQRLKQHRFSADKLMKRFEEGKRSLEFAWADNTTQFVINGDLMTAVDDFVLLTLGRPLPERLQADQEKARDIVRNLLEKVGDVMRDPAAVSEQ